MKGSMAGMRGDQRHSAYGRNQERFTAGLALRGSNPYSVTAIDAQHVRRPDCRIQTLGRMAMVVRIVEEALPCP
jgi:hypothetical protein